MVKILQYQHEHNNITQYSINFDDVVVGRDKLDANQFGANSAAQTTVANYKQFVRELWQTS